MINISNRLKTVASFVLNSSCKTIIDVGCDHALLDIYLLQNNDKLKVIASDINKGPLEKAKENIIKYSFLNKIELRLTDGISSIDNNVDTVVISGMGKETIVEILSKDLSKISNVNNLIISSNNKFHKLREEICKLGFLLEDEKIIYEDGKFYIIMKFIKGKSNYSSKELYFGPCLLKNKDSDFYKYFKYLLEEKLNILDKLPKEYKDKRKKIEMEIKMLTEELVI